MADYKYGYQVAASNSPPVQSIYEQSSTRKDIIGRKYQLDDGRTYVYSRAGAAIAAGTLIQTGADFGHADVDLMVTATGVAGDTKIKVTPAGSVAFLAGELIGGFFYADNGTTGPGHMYRISGNPETTAATEFEITLSDPLRTAISADCTCTVVPSPYLDVITQPGVATGAPIGVAPIAVTSGYYFWLQTWGICCCLFEGVGAAATVFNTALIASPADPGAVSGIIADAGISAVIGYCLSLTVADQDYGLMMLTIQP